MALGYELNDLIFSNHFTGLPRYIFLKSYAKSYAVLALDFT